MNTNTTKPPPAVQSIPEEVEDFDPFTKAKPCSPFYLYNHDSPRPSTDHKSKPSVNVSLHDLEAGSEVLTPSTTAQDKANSVPPTRLGAWRSRFGSKQCQQMTKPKQKGWLARMPKQQRILVKLLIALVVIGCMVGVAVGIAVGLRSGVWKGNNQQGNIA